MRGFARLAALSGAIGAAAALVRGRARASSPTPAAAPPDPAHDPAAAIDAARDRLRSDRPPPAP